MAEGLCYLDEWSGKAFLGRRELCSPGGEEGTSQGRIKGKGDAGRWNSLCAPPELRLSLGNWWVGGRESLGQRCHEEPWARSLNCL